jgi:hypothetical protein
MNLTDYLSKKGKAPTADVGAWLTLCTFNVTTGSLWAGDPLLTNAEDGCVAKVPAGQYVVEGIGGTQGRYRYVSRLRVRLKTVKSPTIGKKLGNTGTDSAMIGVCDIKEFNKACGRKSGDEVRQAIETQTDKGFGILTLKKFPGAVMPFVPTGGDGSGPVFARTAGAKRVGIELPFVNEVQNEADHGSDQSESLSLLGDDEDHFITRKLADGAEASFWLGGKIEAGEEFCIWADGSREPVEYRVRRAGGTTLKKWSPLKMKSRAKYSARERLNPGSYKIDFRIAKVIYGTLKLRLS